MSFIAALLAWLVIGAILVLGIVFATKGVFWLLIVGLLVGIVQAATSINEATLSFVPKLVVVAIILALFGGAIMGVMVDFTREMFARIPEITR